MSDINIPTMPLYGSDEDLDLLHVEQLIVRTRAHRFKIKPHRHNGLHQIFVVSKGSGTVVLDGEKLSFLAPCVITIAEQCVHGFDWSEDVQGHVFTITDSLLQQVHIDAKYLQTNINTAPQDLEQLDAIAMLMTKEYLGPIALERTTSLQALVQLLAVWLQRQKHEQQQVSQPSRQGQLLNDYRKLVEEYYQGQLTVTDYAKQLHVTPVHLNSICRNLSDCTAQQVIHQRLLLEAKRYLTYTVQSNAEIADHLGFADPGYFNRFFKRLTGVTPKQYR